MNHHHLSLYEWEQLAVLKAKGLSFREISKILGRNHATLSREWKNKAKYGNRTFLARLTKKPEKQPSGNALKHP